MDQEPPQTIAATGFECRNCAGHEARALYAAVPDRFQGFPGAFSYVACRGCGLVQLEHVPANPGEFYRDYPIHRRESTLYRAMRRLLIGGAYVDRDGHGKALLDIGCGNGFYISQMASRGWDAVGYEFDPAYAARLAQQIGRPVLGGEPALEAHPGAFDLVTFNFSFEHLDRPLHLLELAIRKLRPGGELYIAVPNIESSEASLFKERWFHLDPPRHITFFTKQLLRRILEERGLSEIRIKDVPVPTGFAGSLSYLLWNRFHSLTWYAAMLPGVLFSAALRDGQFAISARRSS